ncbi:MAG: hypothetical protein D9C04_01020 [Nitrosopumilus sp. B06]|nr:MAG: hypothetical protein D9C04_01020 [Nitrosopumilus sp. B06]
MSRAPLHAICHHQGRETRKKRRAWRYLALTNYYNILSEYGQHFGKILMWCSVASLAYFYFSPDADTVACIATSSDTDHASYIS